MAQYSAAAALVSFIASVLRTVSFFICISFLAKFFWALAPHTESELDQRIRDQPTTPVVEHTQQVQGKVQGKMQGKGRKCTANMVS